MARVACRLGLASVLALLWFRLALPPIIPAAAQNRYNCSDFASWRDAQTTYYVSGGPAYDPNYLDEDGDGLACEALLAASDHGCYEFTYGEAQLVNAQYPWMNLDADGDGIACEEPVPNG